MLINISSDHILLYCKNELIKVPRGGLEISLPQAIYDLHLQEKIGENIYVINGPGSFTNLRVSCLVLNMLKDFVPQVQLFTLAKYELYKRLYDLSLIPSQGLMYIGQQKNYWICDMKEQLFQKQLIDTADIDMLFEADYWVDELGALSSDYMISRSLIDDEVIQMYYNNKQYNLSPQELGFMPVETILPNYILEPNISQPKSS